MDTMFIKPRRPSPVPSNLYDVTAIEAYLDNKRAARDFLTHGSYCSISLSSLSSSRLFLEQLRWVLVRRICVVGAVLSSVPVPQHHVEGVYEADSPEQDTCRDSAHRVLSLIPQLSLGGRVLF
jgi:hypothetical protein